MSGSDESKGECGPGCSCGSSGPGKKVKAIVCLVVLLVAGAFIVHGFITKAEAEPGTGQEEFAEITQFASSSGSSSVTGGANGANDAAEQLLEWGEPLEAIADLNTLAADVDAVFLLLPAGTDETTQGIKQEVEAATVILRSNGTSTSVFTLSESSPDYLSMSSQVAVPSVLAMVKGVGGAVVSGEITQQKLLEAMVTASRPSACGPSGCGPSSAGCP